MARFEVVVQRTRSGGGSSGVRRYALGRLGSALAAVLLTLLVASALLLGYLIAGLLLAVLLLTLLVALLRSAFRSSRS